jgi:O-6-methylguanine DNA methyltransferase
MVGESTFTLPQGLADNLKALGDVAAPPSLVPAVLVRTALADGYWTVATPVGPAFVAWNPDGVSTLSLGEDPASFAAAFGDRFRRRVVPLTPSVDLARAVERRLAGDRSANVRFDLRGLTEFERAVLDKAAEIPRGEVRPYAWVAKEIGRPEAVRAVGSALGHNPVPLLIPCHRVLRSDGRVGGYVFGGEAKRAILDAESAGLEQLADLARSGVRYFGSDTTGIYCYPTCRHARRTTERHLVTFASAGAAAAAGYRPCKVCRPVAA